MDELMSNVIFTKVRPNQLAETTGMSQMALLAKMKLSSDMAVLGIYEKEVQNKITQTTLTKIISQTSETESCCMSILSNTERAILNTSLL